MVGCVLQLEFCWQYVRCQIVDDQHVGARRRVVTARAQLRRSGDGGSATTRPQNAQHDDIQLVRVPEARRRASQPHQCSLFAYLAAALLPLLAQSVPPPLSCYPSTRCVHEAAPPSLLLYPPLSLFRCVTTPSQQSFSLSFSFFLILFPFFSPPTPFSLPLSLHIFPDCPQTLLVTGILATLSTLFYSAR